MPRDRLLASADRLDRLCDELSGRDLQIDDVARALENSDDTEIRRIRRKRNDPADEGRQRRPAH